MVKYVYINHDITLCGVSDPAENNPDVKEVIYSALLYIEIRPDIQADITIGIFEDSVGNQTWVGYDARKFVDEPNASAYWEVVFVYDCDKGLFGGSWQYNPFEENSSENINSPSETRVGYSPIMPCDECREYFQNNTLVGIIAHISNLPESSNN